MCVRDRDQAHGDVCRGDYWQQDGLMRSEMTHCWQSCQRCSFSWHTHGQRWDPPRFSKRRLIMCSFRLALLYADEVWGFLPTKNAIRIGGCNPTESPIGGYIRILHCIWNSYTDVRPCHHTLFSDTERHMWQEIRGGSISYCHWRRDARKDGLRRWVFTYLLVTYDSQIGGAPSGVWLTILLSHLKYEFVFSLRIYY